MAMGSMSWQYYSNQQKYGSSYGAGSSVAGGDMQDMHLKMSKKIAQLTKVFNYFASSNIKMIFYCQCFFINAKHCFDKLHFCYLLYLCIPLLN